MRHEPRDVAPLRIAIDIVARTDKPATADQMMVMLRTLLADRFTLTLHREQQEFRILALAVAAGGHRLKAAAGDGEPEQRRVSDGFAFRHTPMSRLAEYLSWAGPIGVPVVDRTNLPGRFDFDFALFKNRTSNGDEIEAKKEDKRAAADGGPTRYTEALKDLGLRLEGARAPLDVIVVDHAERIPTAN